MRTRHALVIAALLTSTAVVAHPSRTGKLEGTAATARGAVDCNMAGRSGMPGCPNDDFAAATVAMAEVRAARSMEMVAGSAEQYPSRTTTDANSPLTDNTYAPGNVPATSGTSTTGTTGSSATLNPPPPIVEPAMSDAARNRANPAVGDLPEPAGRVQDDSNTAPPPPVRY